MAVKTEVSTVEVDGQTLRVGIRRGKGVPLLIFNGIGANFELLETFTGDLTGIETIVFDPPGIGGSSVPTSPYRLRGLAQLADRMLDELGYEGQVDVLGVSWGGALAQQFAHTCPQRCRRLVLAATSTGVLMVPGSPTVMSQLMSPRRYKDPEYLNEIGPKIYGGEVRRNPKLMRDYASKLQHPHWLGYFYQQMAFWGWSSMFWLPLLRQPTLVLGGTDDPLVPIVNTRMLAWLIPKAKMHLVDDGHLFLMTSSKTTTPLIRDFLAAPTPA